MINLNPDTSPEEILALIQKEEQKGENKEYFPSIHLALISDEEMEMILDKHNDMEFFSKFKKEILKLRNLIEEHFKQNGINYDQMLEGNYLFMLRTLSEEGLSFNQIFEDAKSFKDIFKFKVFTFFSLFDAMHTGILVKRHRGL